MSDEESWGFAAPPFRAEEALVQLKRSLRESWSELTPDWAYPEK